MRRLTLPTDSAVRKDIPLYSGCYSYFPAALAGVAMHSKAGNDKHNPGEPLHHARGKSMDHADCIARHSMDIADFMARRVVWSAEEQAAILTEANAMCWRALALSQELHEKFGAPLAPAARLPQPVSTIDFSKVDTEALVRTLARPGPLTPVEPDYLGRNIRGYSGDARLHMVWCALSDNHAGECVPLVNRDRGEPKASESPCSDQPYVESRRTPAEGPLGESPLKT